MDSYKLNGEVKYAISGDMTEFEDILIDKGITTKENILLNKGVNPDDYVKDTVEYIEEEKKELAEANLDELNELGEDDEFADDNFLETYRQNRIDDMRKMQSRNRFGDVVNISKDQWVHEVTEASAGGTFVIVHLYQDSIIECVLMDEALTVIAAKYQYIKITRIKSTSAVENWPDQNLPTLFIYKDNELAIQLLTLNNLYGKSMKPRDLEWWLICKKVIDNAEMQYNPRDEDQEED